MENNTENKIDKIEKIRFHKEHPVLAAWLLSMVIGFIWALVAMVRMFDYYDIDAFEIIRSLGGSVLWGILIGNVVVFPVALTICEGICLIGEQRRRPVKGAWLFDQYVFWLGGLYEMLYLTFGLNVTFSDWQVQLSNAERHTPVYSGAVVTVVILMLLGLVGYVILQYVPLRKMPPLITVLSISAMYLGVLELIAFTVQTCQLSESRINGCLLLLPTCCVLIVARLILRKVREWNELVQNAKAEHFGTGKIIQNPILCSCDKLLRKSQWWPVLALLLMFPLLGILIAILMLFGQAPDSVIKAFTETSDWNLSLRQAPQNVMYDEHYLCTVAAGGHEKVVKPIRLGRRHGHEVIVNRQLCIANAFEQVLEERTPGLHRALRHFYDTYGFPVARLIRSKYTADLVYFIMKPLEWIFLCVLYLTDAHPENRIAVQYTGKTAAQVKELYPR